VDPSGFWKNIAWQEETDNRQIQAICYFYISKCKCQCESKVGREDGVHRPAAGDVISRRCDRGYSGHPSLEDSEKSILATRSPGTPRTVAYVCPDKSKTAQVMRVE
jgi:hypothetical protein